MSDLTKFLVGNGGIASPVAAIGGSIANVISQSIQNKKNREWTEQQNDLAWQRQNQLINEQRAYDTPKAQMQRLMEAGLNPNLIYDDLGGNMQAQSAPNAAGSYQGQAPQVDPLALSQSLLNMSEVRKNNAQTNQTEALTPELVNNLIADTQLKGYSSNKIISEIGYISELTKNVKEQTDVLKVTFNNLKLDELQKQLDYIIRSGFVEQEVELYSERLGITSEQYKFLSASFALQLAGLSAQAQELLSRANLNSKNAQLIAEQLPFIKTIMQAEGDKAKFEALIAGKDYDYYHWNQILKTIESLAYGFGMIAGGFSGLGAVPFRSNPVTVKGLKPQ